MFKTVQSRFALRAALVGVGAFLASLAQATYGSDLQLGEIILAVSSGWGAGLGYAGLGAMVSSIEPNIGKKT